ncbi:hypothetical protein GCM10022377_06780 [Zhihengliuella alba]|uniref:LysM domain-containing protein n=1 Tax=Zhihengliuella alba TaxID=547018 RepID=A0ABP7CZZ9_9MICC
MLTGFGAAAPAVAAPSPAQAPVAPKTATPANIAAAQHRIAASLAASQVPARLVPAAPAPAAKNSTVTVKAGDTLSHIAIRSGVALSTILKANGLEASSTIFPGQKIKLSGGSAAKAAAPAAPSTGTKTYSVQAGDTLGGIALRHEMSLARLLRLNSGLSKTSIIYPGQKLTVAGGTASAPAPAKPASTSTASSASTGSYTVSAGDTLGGIAINHDMSLSRLLRLNGLSASDTIHPGQKLTVAGGTTTAATKTTAPSSAAPSEARTHTVASGETLSGIAGTYSVGLSKLLEANSLSKTSVIRPGQTLKVPGGATAAASSGQLVPSTFLHYRYPEATVRSANENKAILLSRDLPSRSEMRSKIVATAQSLGVDPSLALAHAYQESGFSPSAVSPANAIGAMQVIPTSGEWASQLVGRPLDLLDPDDNVVAGVAIIAALQRTSESLEEGIASYYQGQGSVRRNGMYDDTKSYVKSVKTHMASF